MWNKPGWTSKPKHVQIHDLSEYLDSNVASVLDDDVVAHMLWADDLVLFADSLEGLKKQLGGLFTLCSRFQMIVNKTKTKIIILGKGNQEAL